MVSHKKAAPMLTMRDSKWSVVRVYVSIGLLSFSALAGVKAAGQTPTAFDVASIRPSSGDMKFERNGKTEAAHGTLAMRDVTVSTCIQWAYGVSQAQIQGPASLTDVHYDITAKTDPDATEKQMRLMLRTLLSDRFKLALHVEKKELHVYSLVVSKGGVKMHPSAPGGTMSRENSATGMVARSITMRELADYLSDPLNAPLTDETGLQGAYDLTIDFTPYVDMERGDVRPDPAAVLKAALRGDLGLDLVKGMKSVDVMVVDHVEPPSSN
jgi:uncharacterized protein (TIGR03435 family)